MREITIPDDLFEKLKADAARQGRHVEEYAVELLRRAFPTREQALRGLRHALRDDLETPDDELLPSDLRPFETPVDHAALRARMPILDPPLSATVISEREDRV